MRRHILASSIIAVFFISNSACLAAPPVLGVSPTYMEFSAYEGGANPEPDILSIWRDGGNGPLNWDVTEGCNWLTVEPNSGTSLGEVDDCNVIVDINGLAAGVYICQLTVDAGTAANSPQIVDVNLTVSGPNLVLSATYFEFTAYEGGANPNDQVLTITNTGSGSLNWQVTEDCNWFSAEPNTGSSTGEADDVNLSVNITSLTAGTYNCQLTVSDPNADNSPQAVDMNLFVRDADGMLYVPSEYSTIQEAIDTALNGDTVVVATGTYTGTGNRDLDFGGKAITLRSTDPNDPCGVAATIIDCNGNVADPHRGFYFHSGEGPNSVVSGLNIKNGYITAGRGGAGIYCYQSSPTIRNCKITNNTYDPDTWGGGAGVCVNAGNPTISRCIIKDNTAENDGRGGGIACYNCGPTIDLCTISGNSGGRAGGIYIDGKHPTITNCVITDSTRGSGIYYMGISWSSNPTINNCTISGNSSSGIHIYTADGMISNCIIWDNNSWEITVENYDLYDPTISYCDIEGGKAGAYLIGGLARVIWGGGIINADPSFVDPVSYNYHISYNSPCIDAGDPNYVPTPGETDIDGEARVMGGRVDIGADEFDPNVPIIEANPAEFNFTAIEGGANPNDQVLTITNTGIGTLNWQITEDCNWLSAEPNSGSSTGEADDVNLSVDITGLTSSIYNCQLTVSDPNAAGPAIVSVTLYVLDSNDELHVPSGYSTIQSAINLATEGATIIVAPGTYTGTGNRDLDFGGKAITVRSTDPNDPCVVAATIIDCNGNVADPHRGFYLHSGEDTNSVVSGLTITNGFALTGGGIYLENSGATISHCRIISNMTKDGNDGSGLESGDNVGNGGGVYCLSSSVIIEDSYIKGNITGAGGDGIAGGGDGGTGGGIYCGNSSSLKVYDSNISENTTGTGGSNESQPGAACGDGGRGGGIFCSADSSLEVLDSVINGNTTGNGRGGTTGTGGKGGNGGGICCLSSYALKLDGCTVRNNTAGNGGLNDNIAGVGGHGGGVFCYEATIQDCNFAGNSAGNSGGEYMSAKTGAHGGGIYCSTGSITLSDCTFSQNAAGNGGGSIHGNGSGGPGGDGGGICCKNCSQVTIEDCIFTDNYAGDAGFGNWGGSVGGDGGGIYCESCTTVTIDNSSLMDNSSGDGYDDDGGKGGGIYCGSASISNCIITGNETGDGGYRAPPGEGYDGGDGAGIFCTSATITNCTITGNNTGEGHSGTPAGVRGQGGGIYGTGGTVVSDSIIWLNTPEQMVGQDCNNVTYSDIGDGTCSSGTGNIDSDPCFVSGPLGDYYLSQTAAGQAADSPCVNTGSDTAANLGLDTFTTRTDMWTDRGTVDMGYHYPIRFYADIDENWHIDLIDFSILGADWLICSDPCAPGGLVGDITRDYCVDVNDLKVLIDCWLDCYVTKAYSPNPSNNATLVDPNVILYWTAGSGAVNHDFYFGTDYNDVKDATTASTEYMGRQDANSWDVNNYDMNGLDCNSSYYWRIDELGPACMADGDIWSFTTWSAEPNFEANLVSHWEFDEGSGTTAADSIGDNNGTLMGDPNWVTGKIGDYALDFDGSGDYVDVADSVSLSFTDPGLTIAAWVYLNQDQTGESAIVRKDNQWGLEIYPADNKIRNLVKTDGTTGWTGANDESYTINTDTWYFFAFTYNGSVLKHYANGAQVGSDKTVTGNIVDNSNNVGIGSNTGGGSNNINGVIDDVRIYDRALNPGDVWLLYQDGL